MALPLLARSCDDVATVAVRGSDEAVSGGTRTARIPDLSDTQLAFQADEAERAALLDELFTNTPRLANHATSYIKPTEPTLRFASALPDQSWEFLQVFGREPTMAMLDDTGTATRNIEALPDAADLTKSADALVHTISTSDESVIAIIGHNADGILAFPDGSTMDIAELATRCAKAEKRCIVLSCQSSDYIDPASDSISGVSRIISTREAVFISRRLSGYLGRLRSNQKRVSYRDLDVGIRYMASQSEDLALTIGQTKRASKVVLTGAGVGALVFFSGDD
ncbi:MAG: hypothetical protein AAFP16_09835 [Pseudomonadota bacterium]